MEPKKEPHSINHHAKMNHELVFKSKRENIRPRHRYPPETPGDANKPLGQGYGGGARNIYILYSAISVYIYSGMFDTYSGSIHSMRSLEELILKSWDKTKPKTIALMFKIRTATTCIRNEVMKKNIDPKHLVRKERTSTRPRCRRI